MNAKVVDRKAAMKAVLGTERRDVAARFAAADAVLAQRPSGLAVASAPVLSAFSAARPYEDRRIVSAPLEHVHDNPFNARFFYDPNVVKEYAASIATRGQQIPASAIAHPEMAGHYILIDGHYRKRALAAAGHQTIDLIVGSDGGALEMYRLSYLLNVERNSQTALDNAFAWRRLIDERLALNEGEVATHLGISAATVNKTLSLLRLPQSAIDKMRESPKKFGVFTGYELSLIAGLITEVDLLKLVDRIVLDDLSSREVGAIRAKLASGIQRKRKETSRQYKIQRDGSQIGSLKEWDSGKVSLEVVLADPKARAALVAELREKFGLVD
jgi:ParB family chromosome partitioning protein